jgi:dolichol-phosphate mannosyltransferase
MKPVMNYLSEEGSERSSLRLSVVVPCYRDQDNIAAMMARLKPVCVSVTDSYEILLIDDGSPDATWAAIQHAAEEHPEVLGIKLAKNHGHQLAVTAGLAHCRGERVLIIDSDLQDPPELLPEMMKLMDAGPDNVYGVRLTRKGVPLWKKLAYKNYYRLLSLLAGCHIPPDSGDFRLISRRVVDILNEMPEHHRFLRGMVSWVGFQQVPIEYHRDARHAGESGYTLSKLMRIAIDGITSFSIKPLRFASILGMLCGIFCVLGVGYAVFGHLRGETGVVGWTSLISVILLLSSLQFFVLGMIGEYIGRLFIEQKRRPLFLVEKVIQKKRS